MTHLSTKKTQVMGSSSASFNQHRSLAGTLAAYEAQRKSINGRVNLEPSVKHLEDEDSQEGEAIYRRSLPSLHFLRWRPLFHLQAPSGWMNDPCAPGYDPSTGLYHLFFQWNPRRNVYGSVAWDKICWGHGVSENLINWRISGSATIKPGAWYDMEGCFTGCMVPAGLEGQPGELTLFYTGVSRLPLHYTLPYVQKTETLAIAQSKDGGSLWSKRTGNPILPEPPIGVGVTGWRDPFVASWPALDRILGSESGKTLYGLISGGIRGQTPTAFVYTVNPANMAQWTYLDKLVDLGLNHNISRWSGDMGINWECANFMTLTSDEDGSSREFIIVGGEGSTKMHPNSTFAAYPQELTTFPRCERSMQWMSGRLQMTQGEQGSTGISMDYSFGGRFDHACLYGVNSFLDPATKQHTAWGWITEEDLPQKLVDRQNWSGMMSLPRALSLISLQKVTGALRSKLKEITSIEVEPDHEDTFTVRTLGMSPAKAVERLRKGTRALSTKVPSRLTKAASHFLDVQTYRFELDASFSVSDKCSRIGLSIFHSESHDNSTATSIYLTPSTETLTVQRPNSLHVDPKINTFAENAPFTLFSFKKADGIQRENLDIRLWFDESVLEIFLNNRCTFASRIYPATKRCFGIGFYAEDSSHQSQLLQARAWDGIRADMRFE